MTSKITRGRTEITVPHSGKDLVFVYQEFGPNTYAKVGQAIARANLTRPSMAQTASLFDCVFDKNDDNYNSLESQQIRSRMRSNWLWTFTGILWTPEGAYIQDDPETREGMPYMDQDTLKQRLESEDPSVRFVPKEKIELGEMSALKLAKDPYVIALAGEEGAEKLARVADAEPHKLNPRVWSLKDTDTHQTRVSALSSYKYLDRRRLDVDGDFHGYCRGGFAFGVSENAGEASAPN